jgi:hypothetical protein
VHTEPPTRFQFDPDNADVVSSREVGDGRAVAFERGDRGDLRSGNEASVVNLMRKDGDDGEAARLG